ncbi:galactose ABC transporter substrate-binding protein [Konateibacter massiliensis]|uniref:galactose ABC transporter substrate-binding protein n=1 Tax=Konateibacter massiliensis TaxID=2002841 RepID=UPI000C156C15|nr:galactose ABC transporter substrate-binding protein [Konateibacter massiliensis]
MSGKNKLKIGLVSIIVIAVILFLGVREYSKQQQESHEIKSIKIGVSIYDEYDTYMMTLMQEITAWAKQKETEDGIAITLEIQGCGGSQITQNDQIESFVDKNYDVVCVGLVDRTDASGVIEKCKSADIPIVFFNRELVKEDMERWDKLYYVGANAADSGNMQGEIIIDALEENFDGIDKNGDGILQYVMLEGEPGHQDAMIRTENSVKTVTDAGYTLQKLGDEIANWSRVQAITKASAWLEEFGEEIEIIFANNDEMALGALEALKNSKIQQYPIIVGVDGIPAGLDSVKKKEMVGTVYHDYRGQAKAIVQIAYALSVGQEIPEDVNLVDDKYVYLPYEKITYDNVQEYIRMLD